MKEKRLNPEFMKELEECYFSKIKEKKIFLVGSNTRAKDYFLKVESILQICFRKLVSICSVDGLINKKIFSSEEWEILQEIALDKLKNQEAILVLDVDGYIGHHSKEEIKYFEKNMKRPVYYLSRLRKIEK
ncbi:MAG: hypothetical protein ACFFAS_03945 [Promethearchaeota archaeon]